MYSSSQLRIQAVCSCRVSSIFVANNLHPSLFLLVLHVRARAAAGRHTYENYAIPGLAYVGSAYSRVS